MLQDMSLGRTRRDSFHELELRTSVEELRRFVARSCRRMPMELRWVTFFAFSQVKCD